MVKLQSLLMVNKIIQMKVDSEELQWMVNEYVEIICQSLCQH